MRSADRILKLSPDNAEALRDRGLGYLQTGPPPGRARRTWRATCSCSPMPHDSGPLRERLVELSSGTPSRTELRARLGSDRHHLEIVLGHAAIRAVQVSGTSSQRVPGAMPSSGRPSASS